MQSIPSKINQANGLLMMLTQCLHYLSKLQFDMPPLLVANVQVI